LGKAAVRASAHNETTATEAAAREEFMVRKLGLVVVVLSLMLAACGRQVTGLGGSGNSIPAGQMLIRFRTLAPIDLNNNRYLIVFNTTGNGQEPYANGFITGFVNFSFAFILGGSNGVAQFPQLFEYYFPPGSQRAAQYNVSLTPQQVQFTPNSNGNGTEFTLKFQRTALLCAPVPNPSPSPTASPSAAATATPTAGPTGATAAPTPTSSPLAPTCATLNGRATTWNINFITTDAGSNPIDALGASGKDDVSFNLVVDTTKASDQQIQRATQLQINPQSAQITGGEIINSP